MKILVILILSFSTFANSYAANLVCTVSAKDVIQEKVVVLENVENPRNPTLPHEGTFEFAGIHFDLDMTGQLYENGELVALRMRMAVTQRQSSNRVYFKFTERNDNFVWSSDNFLLDCRLR